MTKEEINEIIVIELGHFKLNRNSMAYEYLIDSIYLVAKNNLNIRNFNNLVYPRIAQKYNTKPQNVLWCLNKLIGLMYVNTGQDVIAEYFNMNYYIKLSTKAFIISMAKKVRCKLKYSEKQMI